MENGLSVSTLEQWFEAYESATSSARQEAERARDYRDGIQLTAEETSELKKRGQPPVVFNRIRSKIEWLKGLEVKQRTDPKAFPREPKHAEGAEAATDAIRFVCDNQDWDRVRSEFYDNFLIEGYGGVEVIHERNSRGEIDIVINHYPWDRLFYDPHSRRDDFDDARYLGAVIWMDEDDFVEQYPDKKNLVEGLALQGADSSETHDDKPAHTWYDAGRKRIRVVLMWYRKNSKWHWCKFISGEKLGGGESPYADDDGQSVCPLILQSAYVGRNNERYGIVRDMFDPQDEINKRRSKALHSVNSRQTFGVKGALESVAGMKRELAKPDGHIEINIEAFEDAARVGMKPFDMIRNDDQTAANFSLLKDAKDEIDLLGANMALSGETGDATSGRAVLARQQGGMIEIASLNDKLHRFTREVYRHIWMRIRQFWTVEKWVRVTDDEVGARFVGLNRPVTLEERLGQMDPQEAGMVAQELALYPGDPRLSEVVDVENNVEQLDVDIVIEEVPDRVTLEGEMFEALMKYGPTLPPAVLIEADPTLPRQKKEKLLEMLGSSKPSPKEQADMEKIQSEAAKNMATAEKMQSETAFGPQYG